MTDWLVRDRQAVRAALRPLDPRPEIGEGWRGVYGPGETVPTFAATGDDPLVYLRWELQVLQEAGTLGAPRRPRSPRHGRGSPFHPEPRHGPDRARLRARGRAPENCSDGAPLVDGIGEIP